MKWAEKKRYFDTRTIPFHRVSPLLSIFGGFYNLIVSLEIKLPAHPPRVSCLFSRYSSQLGRMSRREWKYNMKMLSYNFMLMLFSRTLCPPLSLYLSIYLSICLSICFILSQTLTLARSLSLNRDYLHENQLEFKDSHWNVSKLYFCSEELTSLKLDNCFVNNVVSTWINNYVLSLFLGPVSFSSPHTAFCILSWNLGFRIRSEDIYLRKASCLAIWREN